MSGAKPGQGYGLQKLVMGFYTALSWVVWAITICGIFFMIFLLCTGTLRRPALEASYTVSAADPQDPALAERGCSGEGWYCVTAEVVVKGSVWSPFVYESAGFETRGSEKLRRGCESFLVGPETVTFSKAEPAGETLAFYVRCPDGEETLMGELGDLGFGLRSLDQMIGFFRVPIGDHIPAVYLRDCAAGDAQA